MRLKLLNKKEKKGRQWALEEKEKRAKKQQKQKYTNKKKRWKENKRKKTLKKETRATKGHQPPQGSWHAVPPSLHLSCRNVIFNLRRQGGRPTCISVHATVRRR